MTMLYCDGFEQYADLADFRRANWVSTGPGGITGFSTGRHGGQRLDLHGSNQNMTIAPSDFGFEFYLGFAVIFTGTIGAYDICRFMGGTGVEQTQVELTAAGELRIMKGLTQLEITSGLNLMTGVWYYLEVYVLIDDAIGEYEVRVNGSPQLGPATGQDTEQSGGPNISAIEIGQTVGVAPSYDDIYLNSAAGSENNGFLGDIIVETIFPAADGNRNDMTRIGGGSNNFEAVDDGSSPDDDSTYNHGNVVGDDELYDFDTLDGYSFQIDAVHAVGVSNHIRKTDAGDRTVRALVRSNAVEAEGDIQGVTADYRYRQHIFELDPDGSVAWDSDSVNAAEFGITIEA